MWRKLDYHEHWLVYLEGLKGRWPEAAAPSVAPREYPCLVSSLLAEGHGGGSRILSAFVYRADAAELMHHDLQNVPGRLEGAGKATSGATQDNFNRWVTAHLLAVAHFLTETGICRPDQYEETLLEGLEMAGGRRPLTTQAEKMLGQLRSPGE